MKSARDRGEFGNWLREQRLGHGYANVPAATAALRAGQGYGVAPSVWAELESGTRRPSAEQRERLQAFFDVAAPQQESTGDMAALLAMLSSQTAALNRIADRLEAQPTVDLVAAMKAATEATVVSLIAQGFLVAPSPPRQPRARQGSRQ